MNSTATLPRLSQIRVTRSEWIKASSLRSTWYNLAAVLLGLIAISIGLSWTTRAFWDDLDAQAQANFDAVGVSLGGVVLAQMVIAVLGVQIISGEYSTGMIRSSFGAVPQRTMVLFGKLTVIASLTFVFSLIGSFAAFFIGQAVLGDHGISIESSGALRSVLGAAFNLTAIAILATSVGFMARSTAGGIGIILGILLVLPVLGAILPLGWLNDIMEYLPANAGNAVMATDVTPAAISPLAGLITMIAWIVAFIAAAAIMLTRRDV